MNRRDFLQRSALASAAMLLPRFMRATADLKFGEERHGKALVVVQLGGGNDGLNTVVPWQNDTYYRLRPAIAHPKADCLRLTDELALAPGMTGLKSLYDSGLLTIVNGVGYPDPNRSHFRSMDIWQTASSSGQYWDSGWIGRMLDNMPPDRKPYHAIEVDEYLSLALKGSTMNGIALTNPQQLHRNVQEPFFKAIARKPAPSGHHHPTLDYLHQTLTETSLSADYILQQSRAFSSHTTYPAHQFAQHLKLVAEMIVSGSDTRVYYVSLNGFDTHAQQRGRQGRLLQVYSEAMTAFCEDLRQNDRMQDVVVMTFSEFGRRVAQNASGGTDHGTANNVFLMGGALKQPGIFNPLPSLVDLEDDDLKHAIDFRQIYANLLRDWLGVNDEVVLGGKFVSLNVV